MEMEGEAAREGGQWREGKREGRRRRGGEGGGCEEKPTASVVKRKKEDIEKGKGGADRDNEKGKSREQKALVIRIGKRMRNVCGVLGGGVRCACGWPCVSAFMCVSPLALSARRPGWEK